jgi:hypothetical protein
MTTLRPADFCRLALQALEAAEGQTRRRKRDQRADQIGLAVKRDLLERAVRDAPDAEQFETWLLSQVLASSTPGPMRAMGLQILDEYRFSALDPALGDWLQAGAPSDDAGPGMPKQDHEVQAAALTAAGSSEARSRLRRRREAPVECGFGCSDYEHLLAQLEETDAIDLLHQQARQSPALPSSEPGNGNAEREHARRPGNGR